jgi:methylthioribulose-1-phosphate dehydratase
MQASESAGLVDLCHLIHRRGWSQGTGGNFSLLLSQEPFRLLITPSGIDKGMVAAEDLLEVDERGAPLGDRGKPSAETLLHIAVVKEAGAKVVLHTHSVWNTLASLRQDPARPGLFELSGYEMLKGLAGVTTHEHVEQIPIIANSQDLPRLQAELASALRRHRQAHAALIAGHGLYTWGRELSEAQRHLEVLEFLFEVALRRP